jgi:uncharacterized protein (DUF433 family)
MNAKLSAGANRGDPREAPAYSLTEAARYIKLPVATLRSWVVGRPYPRSGGVAHSKPLISAASRRPPLLSFSNLIESHVLRSLRTEHGVSLKDVRRALSFAESRLHIERLLLSPELCTGAGRLFLDQYGKLIDLSASGQIALRRMFDEHLKRVEWGELGVPIRLYPFIASGAQAAARPIAIDPGLAFGRPIVARKGVTTQAIADRLDAGESVDDVACDYGLEVPEVEEAVLYERAA